MRTPTLIVLLSSFAMAQDPPPVEPDRMPSERVVRGSFGIDFTNQYFFRGILQENQGFITQPWWELGYGLYEGEDWLRKLDLTFGQWNSLHEGPTGTQGGNAMWYESQFHIGLDALVDERLHLGTHYVAYHSPNSSFTTIEELVFTGRWDDRGRMDSLSSGLQPTITLAIELDGQRDAGSHVGVYLGVGIAPAFPIARMDEHDVVLSVPITLGTSLSDYYEDTAGNDDFFGVLDIGAEVKAPLTFLPGRAGPWDAHAGLHLLLLGDNNEDRNIGDAAELVFSVGIGTRF